MFCEYVRLEYARIHVIYRVNQVEYVVHILVVLPQEYVNTYSTRRELTVHTSVHSMTARYEGAAFEALTVHTSVHSTTCSQHDCEI